MAIGLLILRVVVGVLFIGHGTQKLFGWFNGPGLEGARGFLAQLGYPGGTLAAVLAGTAEAGGGALVALGLLTPLGAAAIIGVMINAAWSVHRKNGVWNSNGGIELPLVYATTALAIAFTGPWTYSVDHALGIRWRGVVWALGALGLGVVTAMAMLLSRSPQPAQEEKALREAA
jgi:putative oxidoreductase